MGTFKKIEKDDVLQNYVIAKPVTTYIDFYGSYHSGTTWLFREPFQNASTNQHSDVIYEGYEEGDVRALVTKTNMSGTISVSTISGSSSGSMRSKYSTILQELSASSYMYPDFIEPDVPDKIVILDVASVYYDTKICDLLWTNSWLKKSGTPPFTLDYSPGTNATFLTKYGGDKYGYIETGSMIVYHDGSGSLRAGHAKYVYKDGDGHWRYNISSSNEDGGTTRFHTSDGGVIYDWPQYKTLNVGDRVGYMLPSMGVGVLTNHIAISSSIYMSGLTGLDKYHVQMISIEGYQEIPVTTYLCHAEKGELNYSNNQTYYKSGSQGQMWHSGSHTTYITKIGLYDRDRKLLGVAMMAQPIRHQPSDNILFKLHLHR